LPFKLVLQTLPLRGHLSSLFDYEVYLPLIHK
jgi:hypothetical protein